MASRLRTPTLGLAGLSMCLCLAIIGTGGSGLGIFNDKQSTNAWLLPIWPDHFDMRELQTLIGTAAAICVLNAILAVAVLVPSLPANGLVIVSSLLSTLVGIVSIAFPTIISDRAPHRDTLKTYTCRWANYHEVLRGYGPPKQFDTLCAKTSFAYWTTIPVFVLQVLLLCLGIYALFSRPKYPSHRGGHEDIEKSGHQLRNISSSRGNASFDTKNGSLSSYQDGSRILGHSRH